MSWTERYFELRVFEVLLPFGLVVIIVLGAWLSSIPTRYAARLNRPNQKGHWRDDEPPGDRH